MTTAKITYKTLESQAFTNVFDIINTRSHVRDPCDPAGNKIRTFVYDSDPFMTSYDYDLLPHIVVDLPELEQDFKTVTGDKKMMRWRHSITVRTGKNGRSNFSQQLGRVDILNIGDDLQELFNNPTRKSTLKGFGMKNVKLTKEDSDTGVVEGKDVYEATYTLEYDSFMNVTGRSC